MKFVVLYRKNWFRVLVDVILVNKLFVIIICFV